MVWASKKFFIFNFSNFLPYILPYLMKIFYNHQTYMTKNLNKAKEEVGTMLSTTGPSLFGIGDINVNIRGVCLVLKLLRAI